VTEPINPNFNQVNNNPSNQGNGTNLSAKVINSPAGISAARIDWVPATISNTLNNNIYLLRTPIGEMSISLSSGKLSIGDQIFFKYDLNGNLQLKPNFSVLDISNKPTDNLPLNSRPLTSNYLSIAVSNLDPIKASAIPGITSNENIANANRVVSSIFPHINSHSFAYAASLFPQTVRGGLLSRIALNDERRMILSGRLGDMVEKALILPTPKIDGSYGWVSWNMPFFDRGYFFNSKWLVRDEEHEDIENEKRDLKHTVVEINTEVFGKIQISCLSNKEEVDLELISEYPINNEIIEDLNSCAIILANLLNIQTRFKSGFGKEHMFEISDND
jgi:hypothetical protein